MRGAGSLLHNIAAVATPRNSPRHRGGPVSHIASLQITGMGALHSLPKPGRGGKILLGEIWERIRMQNLPKFTK